MKTIQMHFFVVAIDLDSNANTTNSSDGNDDGDDGEWNMMGIALEREFLGLE